MLKIEEINVSDESPCIVCGDFTKHRHYFNKDQMRKFPVCEKCCQLGAGGKHKIIDMRAKEYWCETCNMSLAEDKVGQISDDIFLCPECNNKVSRKS